jgi:hypothetical protein
MLLGVWGEAMSEHTKGRIRIIEPAGANPCWLATVDEQDDGGDLICCAPDGEVSIDRWPANARRLVAAWNACEGISTEAIEATGLLHDNFTQMTNARVELERQRDEAVALISKLSGLLEDGFALRQVDTFLAHLEGKWMSDYFYSLEMLIDRDGTIRFQWWGSDYGYALMTMAYIAEENNTWVLFTAWSCCDTPYQVDKAEWWATAAP